MTLAALSYDAENARDFTSEVAAVSGQNLSACYQCRKCAAGCPVAEATGFFTPDRLIRAVVLGDRAAALENPLVWKCVSCYTCGTRCPNGIQTGRITETLKKLARREKLYPLSPRIAYFHDAFLSGCERWGRVNETEFMGFYELRNMGRHLLDFNFPAIFSETAAQARLGLSMLRQGRLHMKLQKVEGRKEIKKLYRKARDLKKKR